MSASPSTNAPAHFSCACRKRFRFDRDDRFANNFCVMPYDGGEREAAFGRALEDGHNAGVLNFRGACFPERLDLRGKHFDRALDFSGAAFKGGADFAGALFERVADFSSAAFERQADFPRAVFRGYVGFGFSAFEAKANFASAEFHEGVDFTRAHFGPQARAEFSDITCHKRASFKDILFEASAGFPGAVFKGDGDFSGSQFRGVTNFSRVAFRGPASFSNAAFSGTIPDFNYAPTSFSESTFRKEAHFPNAAFRTGVVFTKCNFHRTLRFVLATFEKGVDFTDTTFHDYVTFMGTSEKPVFTESASLDLRHVKVEKPDRVSFQTPYLLPHWFVNVDVRKFDFPDVQWWHNGIEREIWHLRRRRVLRPHHKLAITCQQLAVNAEENGRYTQASEFRFWAMNARRHERLRCMRAARKMSGCLRRSLARDWGLRGRTLRRSRRFGDLLRRRLNLKDLRLKQLFESNDFLYWLYWAASGYGEKVRRAFVVLLLILVAFAAAYTQSRFAGADQPPAGRDAAAAAVAPAEAGRRLEPREALAYSLAVMTLQRPDPKPYDSATHTLVLAETILGPLQAALLALAIRRKFMR